MMISNKRVEDPKLSPAESQQPPPESDLKILFSGHFSSKKSHQILQSLRQKKAKILQNMSFFSLFSHYIGWNTHTDLKNVSVDLKKVETFVKENQKIIDRYVSFFTNKDKKFFKILTTINNTSLETPLTPQDTSFFKEYLENIGKRKSAYKTFLKIYEDESITTETLKKLGLDKNSFTTFEHLILFHSKIQNKNYSNLFKKVDSLYKKIENKEEIKKEDRLTKKEFVSLGVIPNNLNFIKLISQKKLLGDIESELDSVRKIWDLKTKIQGLINQQMLPSGSILLQDVFDVSSVTNKGKIRFSNKFVTVATHSRYLHAGIIHRHFFKQKMTQSHVVRVHEDTELDYFDLVTGKCVTFDWKRLISPQDQKKMKKMYGEAWEQKIQTFYAEESERFHSKTDFEGLRNSNQRQFQSVFKLPFRIRKNDPKNMSFKNKTMFCSEFVARSLFCCIDRLNERLAEDLGTVSKDIIKSPFGPRTRFSSVHPGDLVRRLKPYIKPVRFSIIEKMVDQDS